MPILNTRPDPSTRFNGRSVLISRFILKLFFIVKSMGKGALKAYIAIAAALLLVVGIAACGGESSADSNEASEFTPKPHRDSGGGSEQFIVKGGDNTAQEFGTEANASEFGEGATNLHNFLDARAERNWSAACTFIAQKLINSLEKFESEYEQNPTCAAGLKRSTNPKTMGELRAEAAQADAFSLRVENGEGFLIYMAAPHYVRVMPMYQDERRWKPAGLTAISLSPSPEEEANR